MHEHALAWHFGEASVDDLRKHWPARVVSQWKAYGDSIGGLTPLTAEQFAHGILVLARAFGCKDITIDHIFLPRAGREQTVDDIEAILNKWTSHTQQVKKRGSSYPRSGNQD